MYSVSRSSLGDKPCACEKIEIVASAQRQPATGDKPFAYERIETISLFPAGLAFTQKRIEIIINKHLNW